LEQRAKTVEGWRWIAWNDKAITDEYGNIQKITGLGRDITEQKHAEKALKESEEKFRKVFEVANVGKSITSPSGEINPNQTFCGMLGYNKEELKNRTWQNITPPEEIPQIEEKLIPVFNGETNSVRFNKRYIHKNGSYIWSDVSVTLLYDNKGNPLHFITTVVDITEQKTAEKELKEIKNKLEIEVEEKTKELKQQVTELERFYDATIEREFRIEELKNEIQELKSGKS
jgi:PAS domain S-box-containing protein